MSLEDTNENNFAKSIKRERQRRQNPLADHVGSGIYMAITVTKDKHGNSLVDPEGKGRVAAFIPALGGDPDNPLFFQYASPFAGANGSGSYGFFSTPPDAGVTIMVFFADDGDMAEGFYFAVAQEIHDVAAGGAAGKAKVDGTGQGEGSFKTQPSAKSNHTVTEKAQGFDLGGVDKKMDSDARASRRNVGTDKKDIGLSDKLDGKDGLVRSNSSNVSSRLDGKDGIVSTDRPSSLSSRLDGKDGFSSFGGVSSRLDGKDGLVSVKKGKENPKDEVEKGRNQKNSNNNKSKNSSKSSSENEPENHPRNINTAVQGIYADSVRGQTTASPRRNSSYKEPKPNSVYGWKTPGSNAITMDDGSVGDDGYVHPNQIRIQTGSGASIILDGTNDIIYLINSTGSGWVEIGAAGEVMVYAQGSLSMRTEKNFNLRADQNINIEAGENINIKSGNDFHINADDQFHVKTTGSQFFDSGGSNHTKVKTNMYVSTGGILHLNGPQAAQSPGISTVSHADIQNLESTKIDKSILSTMVSHEPMTRKKPAPANTSSSSDGGSTVNSGNVSPVMTDPQSTIRNDTGETTQEQQTNDTSIAEQVGNGSGAVKYISGFSGQTRNKPIQDRLFGILERAAAAAGVDVDIFSGGQDPKGTPNARRTGSIRHDNGFAADVWIYSNGKRLSSSNSSDLPIMKKFCQACFSAGATSIGVGPGYMGSVGIHVDIAPRSPAAIWGSSHTSATAPSWLRQIRTA